MSVNSNSCGNQLPRPYKDYIFLFRIKRRTLRNDLSGMAFFHYGAFNHFSPLALAGAPDVHGALHSISSSHTYRREICPPIYFIKKKGSQAKNDNVWQIRGQSPSSMGESFFFPCTRHVSMYLRPGIVILSEIHSVPWGIIFISVLSH